MKFLLFIFISLIIIAGSFALWNYATSPVNQSDTFSKTFIVSPGETAQEVGKKLETAGLIKNSLAFYIAARIGRSPIQAGEYSLSPAFSMRQIIEKLDHGSADVVIKFQSGTRAEEYAKILKSNFKSYTSDWAVRLRENEGFLYPDTYSIPKNTTIDNIITILTDNFYKKAASLGLSKNSLRLSRAVIIASLLEREGKTLQDKKMIASVIENRLVANMPLQIDAAVQYAIGYDEGEKTWWKKGLTIDDLKVASPFNLYTNSGLPPRPIANPGFNALSAAVNPAKSDYLFYVSDKNGKLYFAKTAVEHNRNVAKYIER